MSGSISATTAMYAMMAATAVSALGSVAQGAAAQEQANAQAQEALNQGAYAKDAAKAHAENIRKAGRAQVGETRASLAASGVKLGEGTALELEKDVAQRVEEDALSAQLSGKRAGDSAERQAALLGKAGDNAMTNSYFSAASTVLAGGSSIAKGWKFGSKRA